MLEKGVLAPESAVWVVVNSITYILGMELELSARATGAHNHIVSPQLLK